MLIDNKVYKDIFDYSSVGIGIMDSSGKFTEVNEKWLKMFGYSKNEIVGMTIDEITYEKDYAKSNYYLEKIISGSIESYTMQKKYLKKNGEIFQGELNVKRTEHEDGKYFNIVGIITDISGQVEYRNKLRQMNIDLKVERNYKRKLLKKQNRLFEIINDLQSENTYDGINQVLKNSLGDIVGNKGFILFIEASDDLSSEKYIGDNRLIKEDILFQMYDIDPDKVIYKISGDNYYNFRIENKDSAYGSLLVKKRKPIDEDELSLLGVLVNHIYAVIQNIQSNNFKQLRFNKLKNLTKLFNKISKLRSKDGIIKAFKAFGWFESIKFVESCDLEILVDNKENYSNKDIMAISKGIKDKIEYYEDRSSYKCFGVLDMDDSVNFGVILEKETSFSEIDREFVKLIMEHLKSIFELNNLIDSSEEKAMVDSLTGIWNRRYMISVLEKQREREENASLVLIDLGNFKVINDLYGHSVGDEVLRFVADIISSNIRETDFACRYGGDEFLVYLPNTSIDITQKIMDRLYNKILKETEKQYDYGIYADYGVVNLINHEENVMESIKRADKKMYFNKRSRKRMELQM